MSSRTCRFGTGAQHPTSHASCVMRYQLERLRSLELSAAENSGAAPTCDKQKQDAHLSPPSRRSERTSIWWRDAQPFASYSCSAAGSCASSSA
jgi:hypothetical protein